MIGIDLFYIETLYSFYYDGTWLATLGKLLVLQVCIAIYYSLYSIYDI
jgi:hypothetical protein